MGPVRAFLWVMRNGIRDTKKNKQKKINRGPVRAFYGSCVTACATPQDIFNPQTGLCEVTEPVPRAWLAGCHSLVLAGMCTPRERERERERKRERERA